MTEPIRVLHVVARMQPGGAEVRLVELIGRMTPGEFRIDVCAHSGQTGPLDGDVRAYGGVVIPLKLDAGFAMRFIRLLRQQRYSVVHSHILHTSGAILALAAAAGVPVRVAHFHATQDGRRSTLRRRAQRRLMLHLIDRYATAIVSCGEGAMDAIWQPGWRDDPRCQVIYDAVDPTRFEEPVDRKAVRDELGIPLDAPLFLHMGRQAPDGQKNHRRLLQIFAEMQRTVPDSWLVLAGANTDDPNGETGIGVRELGIQARVVRLGVRSDVPRLLKAADVLLLPSRWEGLPGVVLEACAVGLPVLATDLPGVREIAARLALVRCLPLAATDAEWASAAFSLPGEAARLRVAENAGSALRASVFYVDRAAEAHRTLWSTPLVRGVLQCS